MPDPNLISIRDKIQELEQQIWSCDWERLAVIQSRITEYKTKLSNGIEYEPAF